jgi:hypothetical protein
MHYDWFRNGSLNRAHGFDVEIRAGSGNLNNLNKWNFCLNAA